jgi:NDP-sugar pyrophosphorylase family protein
MEPHVQACIPKDKHYNMTNLMEHLITSGKRVVSFPIIEYWIDIGQMSDYEKAKSDLKSGELDR